MAIPYPKRRRGPQPYRPSVRGGRVPQFPANDLRPGSVPSGPQTQFPKFNNPIPRKPAPVPGLPKNPWGGFKPRGWPVLPLGIFPAIEIYENLSPWWTPTPDPQNRFPTSGMWEKRYGDFSPYATYQVTPLYLRIPTTYHARIDGQAFSSAGTDGIPWDTTANSYSWWYRRVSSGVTRYAHHSSYFRTNNALAADNGTWIWPTPQPWPYPPFDPLSIPPGAPSPKPQPVPWKAVPWQVPNPDRSPREQTDRGNSPPGDLPPSPMFPPPGIGVGVPISPNPTPSPGGNPSSPPTPGQSPRFERNPIGQPEVFTEPGLPRPPSPGTKERKFTGFGGLWILQAVGELGETADFVVAMWKALPKENRTGYYKLHYRDKVTGELKTYYKYRHRASMQKKVQDLYKHFDKINLVDAIKEFTANQIEDYLYGKLGNKQKESRWKSKYPDGTDFGPKGRTNIESQLAVISARDAETAKYLSDKAKYGKAEAILRSNMRRSALGRYRFMNGYTQDYNYHIGKWG